MSVRLDYIDASRGLAIFTVVYSHICLFCLLAYEPSVILDFLRTYFLNAFFFISGFVAYKPVKQSARFYIVQLFNKTGLLLVPTFTVGIIYAVTHNIEIVRFLFDDAKYGYWFTFVLFEMFTIYYVVCILSSLISKSWIANGILFLIAVGLYLTNRSGYNISRIYDIFCFGNLSNYFIYFSFGLVTREYKPLINKLSFNYSNTIVALASILMLSSYIIYIPSVLKSISILIVVMYLMKTIYGQNQAPDFISPLKNGLLILGRYTLEIYFIHYFLLFPLPLALGKYFEELSVGGKSLSFPEFMIIGVIVISISYTCILLSYFIKKIPFISDIIFGKKFIRNA